MDAQLFFARPFHPNEEAQCADSWTREAERCKSVTNEVFGEADGAPLLAERALRLKWDGRRRIE
jgi:hypothetical protein